MLLSGVLLYFTALAVITGKRRKNEQDTPTFGRFLPL
jgi:hypothetical protein